MINKNYISKKSYIYIYIIFNMYILEAPKDLIRKLLVVDPKRRISIKDALEHSFFHTVVST